MAHNIFRTYGRIALPGEPERFTNEAKHLGGRWYDVYAFRVGRPKLCWCSIFARFGTAKACVAGAGCIPFTGRHYGSQRTRRASACAAGRLHSVKPALLLSSYPGLECSPDLGGTATELRVRERGRFPDGHYLAARTRKMGVVA